MPKRKKKENKQELRGVACTDNAAGEGWVVFKGLAGEEKRRGESETMMGAVMAGEKDEMVAGTEKERRLDGGRLGSVTVVAGWPGEQGGRWSPEGGLKIKREMEGRMGERRLWEGGCSCQEWGGGCSPNSCTLE